MRTRTARSGVLAASFLALTLACMAAVRPRAAAPPDRQPSDYEGVAARLLETGLRDLGAYESLRQIVSVGPRLTGSAQAEEAVNVAVRHMKALGFDDAWTEPTVVGHWVRGERETGEILSDVAGRIPLTVRAIGNSIATPAGGLTAGVVEVGSIAALEQAPERARGRIVFFNGAMDRSKLDAFAAYGAAAAQRARGAVAAAKAGAVAAVVRSLALGIDDDPHTGTMSYDPSVPKVPAVTISTAGAERLSETLRRDPAARLHFETSCRTLPPVTSHNAIGELRGSAKADEVVVIGCHLDSWDLSPGAHDDGAGCAQAIEALRLVRQLGPRPARTIRAVLFMDEENGGTGGEDYARSPRRAAERHIAAIESDRGGFLPLGIGVGATGGRFARIKAWEPLLQRVGLQWLRPGGGGVDIAPLGRSGTVLMSLVPDSQRYFDVHHSGVDTLDKVHPRELELGAISMALLSYLVSEEGLPQ